MVGRRYRPLIASFDVLYVGVKNAQYLARFIHFSVVPRIARFQDALLLQSFDVQLCSTIGNPKKLRRCWHRDKRRLHETVCEPERECRRPGQGLRLQIS